MSRNRTLLASRDPLATELHQDLIEDLGVFVSEPRHLITLADKLNRGQAVSSYELELHANLAMYWASENRVVRMSGGAVLGLGRPRWQRYRLFDDPVELERSSSQSWVVSRFEGRA
jgi:hypothetical protein